MQRPPVSSRLPLLSRHSWAAPCCPDPATDHRAVEASPSTNVRPPLLVRFRVKRLSPVTRRVKLLPAALLMHLLLARLLTSASLSAAGWCVTWCCQGMQTYRTHQARMHPYKHSSGGFSQSGCRFVDSTAACLSAGRACKMPQSAAAVRAALKHADMPYVLDA